MSGRVREEGNEKKCEREGINNTGRSGEDTEELRRKKE